MAKGIEVFGEELRKVREERFYTQDELARLIGTGVRNIQRIEAEHVAGMGTKPFRKLIELLGVQGEAVRQRLQVREYVRERDARSRQQPDTAGRGTVEPRNVRQDLVDELSIGNVEPYSEVQLVEIPLFDLAVAAGGWADVSDVEGAVCNPDQISQSLFRVRISGDSMQPAYKSGEVVEFRCVRVDVDGFEEGKDFYVQQSDGTATFKRCEKAGEEIIVLRALNRKKYPRPMEVSRGLIVRAARAVAKITMLG
jgi:SOS-response transcriptional repressor LexA